MTEPAPDHSWLIFERTHFGRTRTFDYMGRPIKGSGVKTIEPRGTLKVHSDLNDADYAWVKMHLKLAGQGCIRNVREIACLHQGPDVIESGGLLICPACRAPAH